MREAYGELEPVTQSAARRFKVEWRGLPQPVEVRFDMVRAVKDKLPPGKYVMLCQLYDRLGECAFPRRVVPCADARCWRRRAAVDVERDWRPELRLQPSRRHAPCATQGARPRAARAACPLLTPRFRAASSTWRCGSGSRCLRCARRAGARGRPWCLCLSCSCSAASGAALRGLCAAEALLAS